MKKIVLILAIISIIIQLKAQVPNNVSKPYSESNNIIINLEDIKILSFDKPVDAINNSIGKDIYAVDIDTNINIIENGTKKVLTNGKILTTIRIKANKAKSLNFSFEDFFLSTGSKMFIYSIDKKQVMGPITNANNNKVFNTHIIISDEVIIELVSDSNSSDNITLSNLAYGIKNSEYFAKINKATYEKYNVQTSVCETIYDTRHDCNYLGLSSGASMKQANCPEFDNLEKSKRAICVIISHNSDSNHWEAKGGILINTASDVYPNESENYCNSYVLTCAHCLTGYWEETYPYVDPTNIVVRFNWLRKECNIPPSMPACSADSAAWEELINYAEVIDYCDVSYLQREESSWTTVAISEYAFLKINEPLRFKEYYSGWKVYERLTLYRDVDGYLIGPWGGNPMEGKFEELSAGHYSRNITYISGYTADGHSGISMFEAPYLIGINNKHTTGTAIGTIYSNDAWTNTTPRDIIDPDDIFETDYDNGDSIVVEGVERYEKSNCLKSNYNCNPSLDLSNYLTPIFGEEGCCFRLEYIPAMTGFLGGSPYGIRIYRDNETQNTLYYDFGSNIFAGDSATYYNPLNENVITFCVDPAELAADGGKIVIEFQDANGRIICVKEVEVECIDCCSDEKLKVELESEPPTPVCCAYFIFTIDSSNYVNCGFDNVKIYDNSNSTLILGFDIIPWQDTLFTVPFAICNYDTIPKNYKVEFYNDADELICTKVTTEFLWPCTVLLMKTSEGNEEEIFDIKTKNVNQKEIILEYYTKESENIEIEIFNKYNVSQGVILSKESKKGTSEFSLNIEDLKPDIYVIKMNGKNESIIRSLIIE